MDCQARSEAVQRLRCIEGHIRAIQRMLEEDRSCVELIRQTLAVRRALDRVSQLLVSSHVRVCLAQDQADLAAVDRERAIQSLLDALELSGQL